MTVLYPHTAPDWDELYSLDEALVADGDKLLAITGKDHGPWFYDDAAGESHGPFYGPYEPEPSYAPCPCCFESSGYGGQVVPATWTDPSYEDVDYSRRCPECNGTGLVECDLRTMDDLNSEAMEQVEVQ